MIVPRPDNNVWKWLNGILAAILLTGFASWLAFGRSTLSESEAVRFQRNVERKNAEITALVQQNAEQLGQLLVSQAALTEQVKNLVRRLDRLDR